MDGGEPVTIFGRVARGDGSSLAEAAVTLCDLAGEQVDRTASEGDGGYRLTPPGDGTYLVICSSATRRPQASLVAVSGHPTRHDVTLAGGGATLRGRVSSGVEAPTADGGQAGSRPVPEALATLVAADGTVAGTAVTDGDGAFRFDDVADGVYTLTASGYAPVATEVEVGGGRPAGVELVLAAPEVDGVGGPRIRARRPGPVPEGSAG